MFSVSDFGAALKPEMERSEERLRDDQVKHQHDKVKYLHGFKGRL